MVNEEASADGMASSAASAVADSLEEDGPATDLGITTIAEDDSLADSVAATAIKINVKFLGGDDFEMEVHRDVAVSALKTLVRERTGVEEDRQRLIYRGRVLVDAEPLSTYKVEAGHCIHMVARPHGFTPPSAGAPGTAAASNNEAANAGTRAGTLGQRLLMGMGMPMLAGAGQNGSADGGANDAGGHGTGGDNALLNAAGVDGGQLLTNMLGLAGAGGTSGAAGTGSLGDLIASSPTQHPHALWNAIEGRAARGQGREATARGGGGAAADRAEGGGSAEAHVGQTGLEHVRQGLLTLHTLLSTTSRRDRRGMPRTRAATRVGVGAARMVTDSSAVSSRSRSLSPSAVDREARWPRRLAMSNTSAPVSSEEAPPTAQGNRAPTMAAPITGAGRQSNCPINPSPLATVAATPAATSISPIPNQAPVARQVDQIATSSDNPPVPTANTASSLVATRIRRSNGGGAPASPGSTSAWLPTSFAATRPATLSLEHSEEEGEETHAGRERDGDGVEGVERRWPYSTGGVIGRRSEIRASMGGSESSSSDLGSGVSSRTSSADGPPRLVSSSGESDGWDDERGPGSLLAFLRRSQTDDTDDIDAEEKDEEDSGGRAGRGTRKFFVGQWLDVKDTVHNWLEATVMDMSDSGTRLQIHYNGWPPRWDEWLSWDSPRIAPFRTRTQHLPHSQHVSPAPISAVRNAPITGQDDVRVVMPEVSRVLQEIGPMVDELSSCYARSLERDPSTDPMGERAVSHTLPWVRRRVNDDAAAAATASGHHPKVADLASDVAPLLDRLGRMLTDVAPHLARMGNTNREDAAEPGEIRRAASVRRAGAGASRGRPRRSHAPSRSPVRAPATAFRQLVSTSAPAPTSSNINIHIHAIVPLRAPPSPPPPPPPPPTAAVSAVATPTRGERPPLAVAGSRNSPWAGSIDAVGASPSLLAAARAAAASRAGATREPETPGGSGTPRSLTRGIVADSPRSSGARASGDEGIAAASGGRFLRSRSASVASSTSLDAAVVGTPRNAASGSSAAVHSEPVGGNSSSSTANTGSDGVGGADQPAGDGSTVQGGGQRRTGGWRSFLRALGVGGNGSSSRVGGRRDGSEGDSSP